MDLMTLLLLTTMVLIGVYRDFYLLSFIGGFLLLAYVWGSNRETKTITKAKGPKVRPIIVQRKYVGPKSIYPESMKMLVEPNWDTISWWEKATGAAGAMAGTILQGGKIHRR